MGTVFQLPIIESESLADSLRHLREHGIRCIAAHPRADSCKLWQAELATDCCLVFGSEGTGISQSVLDASDEAVAVPMADAVDSLNVASAAAAFLYEAKRQRAGESNQ
jgi:tRNA G18 (ribose-2'-O)-methylase SpoU